MADESKKVLKKCFSDQNMQIENSKSGSSLLDQIVHIESSVLSVKSDTDEILNIKTQEEYANRETSILHEMSEVSKVFKLKMPTESASDGSSLLNQTLTQEVFKQKEKTENTKIGTTLLDQTHIESSVSGVISDANETLNPKTQEENINNETRLLFQETDEVYKKKLDQILDTEDVFNQKVQTENVIHETSLLDPIHIKTPISSVISDVDEILNAKMQEENANDETSILHLHQTSETQNTRSLLDQTNDTDEVLQKTELENGPNESSLLDQIPIKSTGSSCIFDTDEILNAKKQEGNANDETPFMHQMSETQNKRSLFDQTIDTDAVFSEKTQVEKSHNECSLLDQLSSASGVISGTDEILKAKIQQENANDETPILHQMLETQNKRSSLNRTIDTNAVFLQNTEIENAHNEILLSDQIHVKSSVSSVTSDADEILKAKMQDGNANEETSIVHQTPEIQNTRSLLDQTIIETKEVLLQKTELENGPNETLFLDHVKRSVSSISDADEILNARMQEGNGNAETPILHQVLETQNKRSLLDQLIDTDEFPLQKPQVEIDHNESSLLDPISFLSSAISDTDEILKAKKQDGNANDQTPLLNQMSETQNKRSLLDQTIDTDAVFPQKTEVENAHNESSLLDQIHNKSSVSSVIFDTDEILNAKKRDGNANDKTPLLHRMLQTRSLLNQTIDTDAVFLQKSQVQNASNESPLLDQISDETISSQKMQEAKINNGCTVLNQIYDKKVFKQEIPAGKQSESSCLNQRSNVSDATKQNVFFRTPSVEHRRTSLWKLFDPLHSVTKTKKSAEASSSDNVVGTNLGKLLYEQCEEDSTNDSHNESVLSDSDAAVLISFESPEKVNSPLIPKKLFSNDSKPQKKYTEEEFQQILKSEENRLRKEMSDKQIAYEMQFKEKDKAIENKLSRLIKMNKWRHVMLSEVAQIANGLSKDSEETEESLKHLASEKERLLADIKTSKEDVVRSESAFSDFYKRYGQCKSMIKTYKENEENLNKNIEKIQAALDEQSNMNCMVEARSHETLDKARLEIEATKKSYESQTTILEAQLKKAQMKVCSLENELDKVKSENKKLCNIYDELVTKIGI